MCVPLCTLCRCTYTVNSPQNRTSSGSRQTRRILDLFLLEPLAIGVAARSSPQKPITLRTCPIGGCPIWGLTIVLCSVFCVLYLAIEGCRITAQRHSTVPALCLPAGRKLYRKYLIFAYPHLIRTLSVSISELILVVRLLVRCETG
jgi:hypothetical protein